MVNVSIELVPLFEKLVQLIHGKGKNKKILFENYVSPIFEMVDGIHSKYMSDFRKYIETLERTKKIASLRDLLFTVENDRRFSLHEFSRLSNMVQLANDDKLKLFLDAIERYFTFNGLYDSDPYSNAARSDLMQNLEDIIEMDDARGLENARTHVNQIISRMNTLYGRIHKEYSILQVELTNRLNQ